MKLLVFSSTGRTGRHVLEQGIRRGHQITAFTRRPEALAGLEGLAGVIQGDALDLADLRKAVPGHDAVITIVSPPNLGPTTVISQPTLNLVAWYPRTAWE
ncbi:NAD(P)H-binding protein [Litorilinea aerophila]|uniref:NAD(P)-binding domain-containing protein n=1 Tax=Litorilinea aerophila TaxID=1204385 RepID=A0A540VI48_9CHLR|nr:NAD(P)H-binding protein [Litorilinea aerophila]MCC9076089.1 NAD(P)H-binding protein [Litorilinea aerophila]